MDEAAKSIAPGAVVNVRGEDGRAFGTGYFNPKSLIAVRLWSDDCDVAIDRDFFTARLKRALALRAALYDKPFYRLLHAEGDGLPGLVIDRFDLWRNGAYALWLTRDGVTVVNDRQRRGCTREL